MPEPAYSPQTASVGKGVDRGAAPPDPWWSAPSPHPAALALAAGSAPEAASHLFHGQYGGGEKPSVGETIVDVAADTHEDSEALVHGAELSRGLTHAYEVRPDALLENVEHFDANWDLAAGGGEMLPVNPDLPVIASDGSFLAEVEAFEAVEEAHPAGFLSTAGKVMSGITMARDLYEMVDSPESVEGQIASFDFMANGLGLVGGPIGEVFAASWGLGRFADEQLGLSDSMSEGAAELINGVEEGVELSQSQQVEAAADSGFDPYAEALERDRELMAEYENRGAREVNEQAHRVYGPTFDAAAGVDADELQEMGRQAMVDERRRALIAEQQADGGVVDPWAVARQLDAQLPGVGRLEDRIDDDEDAWEEHGYHVAFDR